MPKATPELFAELLARLDNVGKPQRKDESQNNEQHQPRTAIIPTP